MAGYTLTQKKSHYTQKTIAEMENRQTQCDMLLEHLSRGEPITQKEALDYYGIARLASRISDLKREGKIIYRRMIPVKTRYAGIAHVAQYSFNKLENYEKSV